MPRRATPEELLRLAAKDSPRGKLKVYIGMAAGVGKTYRMLRDANEARRLGVDIVAGLIETHGRKDVEEQIQDLEVIPRRLAEYKGVTLEEMDLEAILRRKPDIVVVDELPHTNAPGSKNPKRWEDVEDLLDAGISVMTAMNVQHLEGVQDVVQSIAGIEVKERVPDRIIREADSVIVIDLPVGELKERMRAGKIYAPEQAQRALESFFKESTLLRLRELALLQTAQYLEAEAAETAAPETQQVARVAVAIPFDPEMAKKLILRGSRIAGRMNTSWHALYVRRRRDHPERMSAQQHRQLTENVQLAMSLGASVVIRESEDVVRTILDFVRTEEITLLVLGKPHRRGPLSRLAPGIVHRLLEELKDCDILIAELEED